MIYAEMINVFFKTSDFDGALGFLGKIFHDPACQKQKSTPTDYLHDEDHDSRRNKTAGAGFDEMIKNFKLRGRIKKRIDFIIERLEESRSSDSDTANKFQPFNTIVFNIDLYEFGSVVIDSRHFLQEKGIISRQYGLNHTIIADSDFYPGDDSGDCYGFIYDLNDNKYRITYNGEIIDGKILHYHIKAALIGKFLKEKLIPSLLNDKRFAAFPKALPFRFIMPDEECYNYEVNLLNNKYYECYPAVTGESLAGSNLKQVYLKSVSKDEVKYPDELFLYLLKHLGAGKESVQGFNDLCSLIAKENSVFEIIQEMSVISLSRTERLIGKYIHPEKYFSSSLKKILFNPDAEIKISDFSELRDYIDKADVKNKHPEINRLMDTYFNSYWCENNVGLFTAELGRVELELKGDESELFYKTYIAIKKPAPVHFLQVFWKLFEINKSFESHALEYTDKILRLGIPELPSDSARAIEQCRFFTSNLTAAFQSVPASHRKRFTEQYESRMNDLRTHPSALYRVMAYEYDFMNAPGDEKVVHNDGWGNHITILKSTPGEYTKSVCGLLDLMPDIHTGYTDVWYFIMSRVKALGSMEPDLTPKLVLLLEKYSSGRYFDENLVRQFADILRNAGLEDIPPAIHKLNDTNEFYMEDYYKEWAIAAPAKKFSAFISGYESDTDAFSKPETWEKFLYDSKPGLKYYFDQIKTHPDKETILEHMMDAAKAGPGEIFSQYLLEAAHLTSQIKQSEQSFYTSAEQIKGYIEHVPVLDDAFSKLLVRARIAIALKKIDNREPDAAEYLYNLKPHYSEYPIILYLDVVLQEKLHGIKPAMETMIADWKLLTAKDPVYAKAFLLYTLTPVNDWDSICLPEVYALFRLAQKKYEDSCYDGGVYTGRFIGLDKDPVNDVIASVFKMKSTGEVKSIIQPYAEEFNAWTALEKYSDEEIAEQLAGSDYNLSLRIIKRLVCNAGRFSDKLLGALKKYTGDKDKYLELMLILWPLPSMKSCLLDTVHTHENLHVFIKELSYHNPEQVKEIFTFLNAAGQSDKVFKTAKQLEYRYITNIFIPVLQAIINEKKQTEGTDWLVSIRKKIKHGDPEYILITNNIGVLYLTADEDALAEKTYTELFAIDWSAFTEKRTEADELSDDIMDSIMGGSLDRELLLKFNTYYASAHFNMACFYGKKGDAVKAVDELTLAVKFNPAGYPASMIEGDSDFNSIRDSGVFKKFAAGLK